MKSFIFFALAMLLVCSSCNSNAKDKKIAKLEKANAALKEKLASYNDAIVITHENIGKYVGAIAVGPEQVEKNEVSEIGTYLYLQDLPVDIQWEDDQENQSVKEPNQIIRYIRNSFPGAGTRTFTGKYTVTFPNGEQWSIPWQKELIVK